MALRDIWNRFLAEQRLPRLAAEVAQRSHAQVWNRSHEWAASMRLTEAQGYVRARAATIIDASANAVLDGVDPRDGNLRSKLIEQATQAVVDSVTHELLKSPHR